MYMCASVSVRDRRMWGAVGVVALILLVGNVGLADEQQQTLPEQISQAQPEQAVECRGSAWPMDYMPVTPAVVLPTASLGSREKVEYPETWLPPVDVDALLAEDQASQDGRQRMGVNQWVDVQDTNGQWTDLPNGDRVWTAAVVLEDARSVRLHLQNVQIPAGGELYVYSPQDAAAARGPYVGSGPHNSGEFWAGSVAGDTAYVEYLSPAGAPAGLPFNIDEGAYIYRGTDVGSRADLSCMKDVACYSDWEDISYSVARMSFYESPYWYYCTGQLLATEIDDLTPYFLTSAHCIDTQTVANTLECEWFYQRSSCGGGFMTSQYTDDAEVIATSGYSGSPYNGDWTLLLIKGVLPPGVFWTGWTTASISTGSYAVGVSHPQGSWKRYSKGRRLSSGGTWWQQITFDQNLGTIDEGSSGSGIWTNGTDPTDQLLYGNCSFGYGATNCDDPENPVYYGKFSQYYGSIDYWLGGGLDDPFENNDSCAAAYEMVNGSYVDLVVKSVDEDWFTAFLHPAEELSIDLTFTDAYGNIDVQVYDSCGGSVVASSTTTNNNESISYMAPSAGNYYIRVYLADDTRNTYNMTISGLGQDCNSNGIVDACELDCGSPGGSCYGVSGCGTGQDCNTNYVPDDCDISGGYSPDCNSNGVPDDCDLRDGTSTDCNTNYIPDDCDISEGTSDDCQPNDVPDECDIRDATSMDTNTNGVPDECEYATIQSASSCRNHGAVGELCFDIGIGTGSRFSGDNVECRNGGTQKMVFETDLAVSSFSASVDCAYHTYTGTVTETAYGGTTVTVEFDPGLPNNDCCTITLSGPELNDEWSVANLLGDADRNMDTNSLDYSSVKLRLGLVPNDTTARYDLNCDGDITSLDYSAIKLNIGSTLTTCP